jgi:hypothetical protein
MSTVSTKNDWYKIERLYMSYAHGLSDGREHRDLIKSFPVIKELLKEHYPSIYRNPFSLTESMAKQLRQIDLSDLGYEKRLYSGAPRIFIKALRLESLIKDVRIGELIAPEYLSPTHLIGCFSEWLLSKGWSEAVYRFSTDEIFTLTAEKKSGKHNERIFAYAAGPAIGDNFKGRLSRGMLQLMEKQYEEKDCRCALLTNGDELSQTKLVPYLSFLKKGSFEVYSIKSARDIAAL